MAKLSAAICCYRRRADVLFEVLLIHPGGPYFVHRDAGVWSFPKGECEPGEALYATARREFAEEVGCPAPAGEPLQLGEVRQRNGKRVVAFALEGDDSVDFVASNDFELEWPPNSGVIRRFPEADRGGWFVPVQARSMLIEAQVTFLDRLSAALSTV